MKGSEIEYESELGLVWKKGAKKFDTTIPSYLEVHKVKCWFFVESNNS